VTDHDRLFKELLTTFFWDFLEIFVPSAAEYIERESIVFLDKEVFTDITSGERHEVDLLARCRFKGKDSFFLLHGEHQAQSQGEFNRRMFGYFARLTESFALPVYPIALFSFEEPRRAEPDEFRIDFPDLEVLRFRYVTIQLNRLDWRAYLDRDNPVASALMARMHIDPADRPKGLENDNLGKVYVLRRPSSKERRRRVSISIHN
jgi:hypothetical protein